MDGEIDAKTFWKAIGCRAIGVAIVTAKGTDGPAGFLALSATHLSASPPMMLVSIGITTSALGAVRHGNHFAINYVPKGRDDLAKEFGGGARSRAPTGSSPVTGPSSRPARPRWSMPSASSIAGSRR
jgi:flavin reductase (DIM6/NTAB) family NADH-FMN oxidoreductase RutF